MLLTLCDARRRKVSISAGDASQMPPVPPRPMLLRSTWLPARLPPKPPPPADGGNLVPWPPLPASTARSGWLGSRLAEPLPEGLKPTAPPASDPASSTLPLRLCIDLGAGDRPPLPPGRSWPAGDSAPGPPPPPPLRLLRLADDRLRRDPDAAGSAGWSRGLCCALSGCRAPPMVPWEAERGFSTTCGHQGQARFGSDGTCDAPTTRETSAINRAANDTCKAGSAWHLRVHVCGGRWMGAQTVTKAHRGQLIGSANGSAAGRWLRLRKRLLAAAVHQACLLAIVNVVSMPTADLHHMEA